MEAFIADSASQGAPGIDEIQWLKPVRPGDRLSVRPQVVELRESRTRADAGFVKFLFEVVNQHGAQKRRLRRDIGGQGMTGNARIIRGRGGGNRGEKDVGIRHKPPSCA